MAEERKDEELHQTLSGACEQNGTYSSPSSFCGLLLVCCSRSKLVMRHWTETGCVVRDSEEGGEEV